MVLNSTGRIRFGVAGCLRRNFGRFKISDRSLVLALWRCGTAGVKNARRPFFRRLTVLPFFFFLFDRLPVRISASTSPSDSTGKESVRSELLTLECSFLPRPFHALAVKFWQNSFRTG